MSFLEKQRLAYVPNLPNVFKAPFQVVEDDITARMSSSVLFLKECFPATYHLNSCHIVAVVKLESYMESYMKLQRRK